MAWRDNVPAYGTRPVSRDIRENFAYLKAVADTLSDSAAMWTVANEAYPLEDAVAGAGAADTTIIVRDRHTLTGDLVVPANVSLNPLNNCLIDGAFTLTINGPFDAGLYQVFDTDVTVVFNPGTVDAVRPEWWDIDGTADEVEINKAITAAANVLCVELAPTYNIDDSIEISTSYMRLYCPSGRCIITTDDDINALVVTACLHVSIDRVRLNSSHAASTKAGLRVYDGVYYSSFNDITVANFKYGLELYSSAAASGVAYNNFRNFEEHDSITHGLYGHQDGTGWINENGFDNKCSFHPAATGNCVRICGNENIFNGCSFENGSSTQFAILDYGRSSFISPRLEVDGMGYYSENTAGGFLNAPRFVYPYYSGGRHPRYACNGGYLQLAVADFIGGIDAADRISTTVDANANSGQKVVSVASTTNMETGDAVCINEGGDREEWGEISSISDGVSITLYDNLIYDHTAVQADAVICKGKKYGIEYFKAWNEFNIFVNGLRVMSLDNSGNIDIIGNIRASGNLGVGNSAAGDVTATSADYKIRVYDEDGNSLGYIQVYGG